MMPSSQSSSIIDTPFTPRQDWNKLSNCFTVERSPFPIFRTFFFSDILVVLKDNMHQPITGHLPLVTRNVNEIANLLYPLTLEIGKHIVECSSQYPYLCQNSQRRSCDVAPIKHLIAVREHRGRYYQKAIPVNPLVLRIQVLGQFFSPSESGLY